MTINIRELIVATGMECKYIVNKRGGSFDPLLFPTSSGANMLVSADYSQIEMRILAHFCQDQRMLALFHEGGDIYRAMMADLAKKPVEAVTDEEREQAKVRINFEVLDIQNASPD